VDILDNDYLTTSKCPDRLNIFQLPNVVFQHYKPISHSNRAIKTNTSNPLKYSHIKQDKMRDEHTKKKKKWKERKHSPSKGQAQRTRQCKPSFGSPTLLLFGLFQMTIHLQDYQFFTFKKAGKPDPKPKI